MSRPSDKLFLLTVRQGASVSAIHSKRVIAEPQYAVVWKIHGRSRRTLLAGARNKVHDINYQRYLQRCLLNSSSSQNQEILYSGRRSSSAYWRVISPEAYF